MWIIKEKCQFYTISKPFISQVSACSYKIPPSVNNLHLLICLNIPWNTKIYPYWWIKEEYKFFYIYWSEFCDMMSNQGDDCNIPSNWVIYLIFSQQEIIVYSLNISWHTFLCTKLEDLVVRSATQYPDLFWFGTFVISKHFRWESGRHGRIWWLERGHRIFRHSSQPNQALARLSLTTHELRYNTSTCFGKSGVFFSSL